MLAEIDSHELAEWQAYDQLEPIDHAMRGELSAGIVASTIANCHRDKNVDPYEAQDFVVKWGAEFMADEIEAEAKTKALKVSEDAVSALGLTWQ